MMENEFGLRDKLLLFLFIAIFGIGFALYHANVAVSSEEVEGVVTGIGTATDEHMANNPVITVQVAGGREAAVLYPASKPLPKIGESVKLLHGINRFIGDSFAYP